MSYYRRDGTKYSDVLEWGRDFENVDRHVGSTKLWWGGWVSTVWLGLDHQFSPGGPPLIFETMVFPPTLKIRILSVQGKNLLGMNVGFKIPLLWPTIKMTELDCHRYSTLDEAKRGHRRMVRRWLLPVWPLERRLHYWYESWKARRG
jgi:hypothetical protein